jgi:hypothetical protein
MDCRIKSGNDGEEKPSRRSFPRKRESSRLRCAASPAGLGPRFRGDERMSWSTFRILVTTGLDPVVHGEMPHGLPDQVRQ